MPLAKPITREDVLRAMRFTKSNRAAAKYLGVGQKMDTGGMDLWKDIVFKKDQQAMDKMVILFV